MPNAKCLSPTEAFLTSEALAKEVAKVGKPKRIRAFSLVYRSIKYHYPTTRLEINKAARNARPLL